MAFKHDRLAAIKGKQRVLSESLHSWLAATLGDRKAAPKFAIHFLQTRHVDSLMSGLRQSVENKIAAPGFDVARSGQSVETTLLAASEIWEFFRSKLAQRLDPAFAPFLRVADELAWQCYRPIRDAALGADSTAAKAPPLVFLNNAWSPFTVTRDREYQVHTVPRAFTRDVKFEEALARMPFPVIGVPWYQNQHLPDAVSICHEVGHSIEVDFGFGAKMAAAIEASIPDAARASLWQGRGSELFADLVACLAVGPAYPWALATVLLTDAATLVAQTDPSYPSIHARMVFCATVVRHSGLGADADDFMAQWMATLDGAHVDEQEAKEAAEIARRFVGDTKDAASGLLLNTPAGGAVPLRSVLKFGQTEQNAVEAEVEALRVGADAASADIRTLFASAVFVSIGSPFTGQARLLQAMLAASRDELRNAQAIPSKDARTARDALLANVGSGIATRLLGG